LVGHSQSVKSAKLHAWIQAWLNGSDRVIHCIAICIPSLRCSKIWAFAFGWDRA
jgi:hypothetical protein